MKFILYFIFRRIFVKVEEYPDKIIVTRGLLLRRCFAVPLRSVTRVETLQTPLLRLLRGRRVEIATLRGGIYLYLGAAEKTPFVPEYGGTPLRASTAQAFIGAFADTRALSGAVTFALLLRRMGSLFGERLKAITSLLTGTADEVQKTLSLLNIAVPHITAFLAVFVGAAWLSAFAVNLLGMCRFCVFRSGDYIIARHGAITLYESFFPQDKLIPVRRSTPLTILLRRAPIYAHGAVLFPAADRELLIRICGEGSAYSGRIRSRSNALFSHCAAPLRLFAAFSVILLCAHKTELFIGEIARSLLWAGIIISLWYVAAFALYMRLSGFAHRRGRTEISCRIGTRLYTAEIPDKYISSAVIGQNPLQRRAAVCDIALLCAGRVKYRLRGVPANRLTPKR